MCQIYLHLTPTAPSREWDKPTSLPPQILSQLRNAQARATWTMSAKLHSEGGSERALNHDSLSSYSHSQFQPIQRGRGKARCVLFNYSPKFSISLTLSLAFPLPFVREWERRTSSSVEKLIPPRGCTSLLNWGWNGGLGRQVIRDYLAVAIVQHSQERLTFIAD